MPDDYTTTVGSACAVSTGIRNPETDLSLMVPGLLGAYLLLSW